MRRRTRAKVRHVGWWLRCLVSPVCPRYVRPPSIYSWVPQGGQRTAQLAQPSPNPSLEAGVLATCSRWSLPCSEDPVIQQTRAALPHLSPCDTCAVLLLFLEPPTQATHHQCPGCCPEALPGTAKHMCTSDTCEMNRASHQQVIASGSRLYWEEPGQSWKPLVNFIR